MSSHAHLSGKSIYSKIGSGVHYMLECPNCRRAYRVGTHFCGSCGTPLAGTISAVVSSDHSVKEPPASGQRAPGFQAMDSLEDTLLCKKPDGFSWQAQRTIFVDEETQPAAGLVSADVEEVTITLAKPALWPIDSPAPTIPATPVPPSTPVLPVYHTVHGTSGTSVTGSFAVTGSSAHPAASVASGLPGIAAGSNVVTRPASAPGEHVSFAIPARPGRAPGSPIAPEQSLETAGEITLFAPPAHEQAVETPGNRTAPGLPSNLDEAPVDFAAFTPGVRRVPLDRSASEASALSTASTPRPLDETYISSDLFAEIIEHTLPDAIPGAPALAPEVAEPTFSVTAEEVIHSVIPNPPARSADTEDTARIIPATPGVVEAEQAAKASVPGTADELAEKARLDPAAYFAPFLKLAEVPVHLRRPGDPHWHLKQELIAQRMEITAEMDELLPLVYDNHREENQTLFASILANSPPLEDEAWGHAAFVLGAYGNYMYRNQLSFAKKLEIWRAQLW